ncbi:MAG TPA: hypothetical protein ENO17_04430, partial [Candidatus Atribacteria bacterium]|nr:hypothetical protein [Candidatus Atribacteria bacterium]
MKNLNIKAFLFIFLGISAVIWFGIASLKNVDLSNFIEYLKILPQVVSIDLVIYAFFVNWGWKLKIFRGWLVPFPNLNGTWEGFIDSDWIDTKTNKKNDPISVILTIKQKFSKIDCVMKTTEMVSQSYVEDFKINKDKQIQQLVYCYISKPKLSLSNRSSVHEGAIVFEIIGNPASKLKGEYWTTRKTTGEIILK